MGDEKGGLTVYENKASSAVAPVVVEIAAAASPLGLVDVDIHASAAAYSAPTLVDFDGDNDLTSSSVTACFTILTETSYLR